MHGTLRTCRCTHAYQCNVCGESLTRLAPPTLWRPLFVHSYNDGISKVQSHAPQLKTQSESFRACRRYKVIGRRLETIEGMGGGVFLKEIFLKWQEDAAQHRIGSGCVLSQQLVTQTALSCVSGAQPSCSGSADRTVRFGSFAIQPEPRLHRRVRCYQADKCLPDSIAGVLVTQA